MPSGTTCVREPNRGLSLAITCQYQNPRDLEKLIFDKSGRHLVKLIMARTPRALAETEEILPPSDVRAVHSYAVGVVDVKGTLNRRCVDCQSFYQRKQIQYRREFFRFPSFLLRHY